MPGDALSISQTGLQGINQALQAVSDNLANTDTTGYRAESVEFGTLLGSFVNGGQLGGGVEETGINRDFSTGPIAQSNSATDMAIEGDGFFVLKDVSGTQFFTRDGHSTVGADGTLRGTNGLALQGFALNSAGQPNGTLSPIAVPQGLLAPTASTKLTLSGNLNSASPAIAAAIDPTNPATFSSSVSSQVFDSVGISHVITYFFQNAGPDSGNPGDVKWNWLATLDGSKTGLGGNSGSFDFNTSGSLALGGTPGAPLTASPTGAAPLSIKLDFTNLTQFAAGNAINAATDGNAAGTPQKLSIDGKGLVTINYSNGQSVKVAQIAIATFAGEQGLQLTPGGLFQQTPDSGAPTITTSGSGSAGIIRPSALEGANVDTTNELVQLVALQRAFQANAKALQTTDNVLANIVELQTR